MSARPTSRGGVVLAAPRKTSASRLPAGSPAPAGLGRPGRVRDVVSGVVLGLIVGILGTAAAVVPGRDAGLAQPPATDPAATSGGDPLVAARVAELTAQEAERDAVELSRLTSQAEEALGLLGPVMVEAAAPLESGSVPEASRLAEWRSAATATRATFGDPPSAGTEVNIARSGLVAALGDVDLMLSALELASSMAEPAPVVALAQEAWRDAAFTWSVGATQLDAVNVATGNGHVHLFLPAVPGSGALTADPAATGAP